MQYFQLFFELKGCKREKGTIQWSPSMPFSFSCEACCFHKWGSGKQVMAV